MIAQLTWWLGSLFAVIRDWAERQRCWARRANFRARQYESFPPLLLDEHDRVVRWGFLSQPDPQLRPHLVGEAIRFDGRTWLRSELNTKGSP